MQHPSSDAQLPIKLDSTSNGEFTPIPLTPRERAARRLALQHADDAARRTGMDRRKFLASACGAAATLLAYNEAWPAGQPVFDVPRDAAFDPELAASLVGRAEAAGYKAIVVTLDTWVTGWRPRRLPAVPTAPTDWSRDRRPPPTSRAPLPASTRSSVSSSTCATWRA